MHTEQTIREELRQLRLAYKCIDEMEHTIDTIHLMQRLSAIESTLEWVLKETLDSGIKNDIEETLDDDELKRFKNKFGHVKYDT